MNEEKYIKLAIKEAKKAYKYGDIPVGCIIIKNNKIISKAYNKKEKNQIATYHAEILAINKACKKLKTWHLDECILISTMEPCKMCTGAIIQSRIKNIIYLVSNENFGNIEKNQIFKNKKYKIKKIYNEEIINLLKNFFEKLR